MPKYRHKRTGEVVDIWIWNKHLIGVIDDYGVTVYRSRIFAAQYEKVEDDLR